MIANGKTIKKYIEDFDPEGAFILLELKNTACSDGSKELKYNYHAAGNSMKVLMALGQLIDYESKMMGISFDEALDLTRNLHLGDKAKFHNHIRYRLEAEINRNRQ